MKIYVDADACPVKDVIILKLRRQKFLLPSLQAFLIILMQSNQKAWKQFMLILEQMLRITELCS